MSRPANMEYQPDQLPNKIAGRPAGFGSLIHHNQLHILLFVMILIIGVFARTWEFRSLPPGLNQDEASSGVDAFDLLHYGVDRNGVSFPVLFISWGSGQNALYAYSLIPSIALVCMNSDYRLFN